MRHPLAQALLLVLFTVGGCAPSWIIVKQASPNPLAGKRSFAAQGLGWDQVLIGAREQDRVRLDDYVNKKKPEEQAPFREALQKDFAGAGELFKSKLSDKAKGIGLEIAAAPGEGVFGIKSTVKIYEPGFWSPVGFGNRATELHVTVVIADAAGNVVDEVGLYAAVMPGTFNPATGQRIREAAEAIGAQLAKYLEGRTAGR